MIEKKLKWITYDIIDSSMSTCDKDGKKCVVESGYVLFLNHIKRLYIHARLVSRNWKEGAPMAGKRPHVLAVPFPAQGHVKPLMSLCRLIAKHGIKVTFVNAESIHVTNALTI